MSLALRGTASELDGPRARKVSHNEPVMCRDYCIAILITDAVHVQVCATASYASVELSVEVLSADDLKRLSPLAKSLVLSFGDQHVTTSNAMMWAVARLAPACGLSGKSEVDTARIDGWLSFVWTSVDLPMYVLASSQVDNPALQNSLESALEKLDSYLNQQRYLVGDSVTLADISLLVSLQSGRDHIALKEGSNLFKWFESMSEQISQAEKDV